MEPNLQTVTYYHGPRQTGVTTTLLKQMNQAARLGLKAVMLCRDEATRALLEQRYAEFDITAEAAVAEFRVGRLHPPETETPTEVVSLDVVHHEGMRRDLEPYEVVFVNDYRSLHPVAGFWEHVTRKFPELDFYLGQSVDDPTAWGRRHGSATPTAV